MSYSVNLLGASGAICAGQDFEDKTEAIQVFSSPRGYFAPSEFEGVKSIILEGSDIATLVSNKNVINEKTYTCAVCDPNTADPDVDWCNVCEGELDK